MREEITLIIRVLGIDIRELVFDIELDFITFNSIEWYERDDKIYLYVFDDDVEYCTDYDDLNEYEQRQIYLKLAPLLWN